MSESRSEGCSPAVRWACLILTLLLICPPVLGRSRKERTAKSRPQRGPIHAYSWHRVPRDCENITPMLWVSPKSNPERAARYSRTLPEGRVALVVNPLIKGLMYHPKDKCRTADDQLTEFISPWPEHGLSVVQSRIDEFFKKYRQARGRADIIVMDFEHYMSNWSMSKEHLQALEDDPRSPDLRNRLGFSDFHLARRFRSRDEYLTWNATLHEMICGVLDRAVFDPVRVYYPHVKMSNYKAYEMKQSEAVPNHNGHYNYYNTHAGTHGAAPFYGRFGSLSKFKLHGRDQYGKSPFSVLRWQLNTVRAIQRSSRAPFTPWIAFKELSGSVLADNPYYEEMILHLALSGADGFFYWNPQPSARHRRAGRNYSNPKQDELVDLCIEEFNQQVGKSLRRCVTLSPIEWGSPYLATGMELDGERVLWRITVPEDVRFAKERNTGKTFDVSTTPGFWYESLKDEEVRFELIR